MISVFILQSVVVSFVIPLHLFGEHLVFCFVLALSELFGSPEFCQIQFLLWFQTLGVMKGTEITKSKINYTTPEQSLFSKEMGQEV